MMKKQILLVAVAIGYVAVTLLFAAGFNTKILIELVVLGTVGISLMTKLKKLQEDQQKARLVSLVHTAAIVILSGCFLWEAGVL